MKLVPLFLELFCGSGARISAKCVVAFRICHKSNVFRRKKKKRRRDRTQEAPPCQLRLVPKNEREKMGGRDSSRANILRGVLPVFICEQSFSPPTSVLKWFYFRSSWLSFQEFRFIEENYSIVSKEKLMTRGADKKGTRERCFNFLYCTSINAVQR